MRLRLSILFFLLALSIPSVANTSFEKPYRGEAKASKDDPTGISLVILGILNQETGEYELPENIRFRVKRKNQITNEVKTLKVDQKSNRVFDASADFNVPYIYSIEAYFDQERKWYPLKTSTPIEGYRPSISLGSFELIIKASRFNDKVIISWEDQNPNGSLAYNIHITENLEIKGDPKYGFSKKPGLKYLDRSTRKKSVIVDVGEDVEKLNVTVKSISKRGETRYFNKIIDIKSTSPQASRSLERQFYRAQCKVVDQLESNRSYALSYLPKPPKASDCYLAMQFDSSLSISYHPGTKLNFAIVAYLEKMGLQQTNNQKDNCIKTFYVSSQNHLKNPLSTVEVRYDGKNITYEWNTIKIEVEYIQLQNGTRQKKLRLVPNEYPLIDKYGVLAGAYVWVELPEEFSINSKLILALQRKLKQLKFYNGSEDGLFSSRLRTALIRYQEKQQLPIGNLDLVTIESLGLDLLNPSHQ